MKLTTIQQHNYYQLEDGSGGMISGFIDDKSKYRIKYFPVENTVIFDNTVLYNEDYLATVAFLTKYDIPYKASSRGERRIRCLHD